MSNTTRRRIEAQFAIVATLEPRTDEHRTATNVLLLLHDSLHIQQQIDTLMTLLECPA